MGRYTSGDSEWTGKRELCLISYNIAERNEHQDGDTILKIIPRQTNVERDTLPAPLASEGYMILNPRDEENM